MAKKRREKMSHEKQSKMELRSTIRRNAKCEYMSNRLLLLVALLASLLIVGIHRYDGAFSIAIQCWVLMLVLASWRINNDLYKLKRDILDTGASEANSRECMLLGVTFNIGITLIVVTLIVVSIIRLMEG